jgi:hypothetical protein
MIIEKKIVYNILDVDERILSIIKSIILNSTDKTLNTYLETLGAKANLISKQEMDILHSFADQIHKWTLENK